MPMSIRTQNQHSYKLSPRQTMSTTFTARVSEPVLIFKHIATKTTDTNKHSSMQNIKGFMKHTRNKAAEQKDQRMQVVLLKYLENK